MKKDMCNINISKVKAEHFGLKHVGIMKNNIIFVIFDKK
jgi:hypothetical protein